MIGDGSSQISIEWDACVVRAFRMHIRLSQRALAADLGVRQQTVSEWETGLYRPRGASVTLLNLLARDSGFESMSTEVLHPEGHVGPPAANMSGKRAIHPIFDQKQPVSAVPLVHEDSEKVRFGSSAALVADPETAAHVSRQARAASWWGGEVPV